ncbi:hypothetical protein SAY87_009026 [Trapa incisa]|uniref:Uncharacterized protein n=1 Tax=Trapa incisa TaxID=236973 RepID=A0AAN7PWY4_9MYRT|nr:hypothetical protein SAY87_009026 [Trapa incisa]
MSAVHGRHISQMRQSGRGCAASIQSSREPRSRLLASKKLDMKSSEGRESMFSHPTGSPASFPGKGMTRNCMLRFGSAEDSSEGSDGRRRRALRGVRSNVTVWPRPARSLARSTKGMRWLCDMKGRRRKWMESSSS